MSYNSNSQQNLQKKNSHPNTSQGKPNTFTYGHQGSQHSN